MVYNNRVMDPVSIILKVWNASRHVKLCLESILQDSSFPFELIIIDNGSRPKLKDYLRKVSQSDARIRLIENPRNLGPGHANRQGASVSEGVNNLICLLDSDVLVPNGWLGRLVDDFYKHPGLKMVAPMQPEEGVVYPFGDAGEDSKQVWQDVKQRHPDLSPLQQFLAYSQGLDMQAFEAAVLKANPAGIRVIEAPPDFLSSCCVLVDGGFAAEVGGIADPDFRGYGSEDVDLCWRIEQAGGQVAKTTSVYVHHFQGASLEDNQVNRSTSLRRANQILYEKWKEWLLEQVAHKTGETGIDLVEYLESHFIYSALARNTSFIDDLRSRLANPDVPEDIVWRPHPI
ncbi:MAG: glycosyltransferase [Chloroflexota bacterium]|nr:MAG: glycosyltransferase [Chloroflexota bacterium]